MLNTTPNSKNRAMLVTIVTAITLAACDYARDMVAQSENRPVLLIHGVDDRMTAASYTERVYANGNPATTVLETTDWGPCCVSSIRHNPRAYEAIILSFLQTHVPSLT